MELTRILTNNYNKGKHPSCMFVDYKKAFETLDHSIIGKLQNCDFAENAVNCIKFDGGMGKIQSSRGASLFYNVR